MSTPAPTAEPTPTADPADPTADPAENDAHFQQTLRILLDAGTKLVQELLADTVVPAIAKAEPYDRLARAIRRTIVLARHIAENPAKRATSAAERRTQSRRQVIRDVENAIQTRVERPEAAESLRDELDERLDDPEFDRDLATRPIGDIIRDLKRDLGLERNFDGGYNRRTPADIRVLNARGAAAPPPPTPEFVYEPAKPSPTPSSPPTAQPPTDRQSHLALEPSPAGAAGFTHRSTSSAGRR